MSGMAHTINGHVFDMQRVDFSVPFGDVEIWEYRNTGTDPHPMHIHAGQFQVLSRSTVVSIAPEDTGWKDTVIVNSGETVQLLVRFDKHSGVFLHHCHNLEHEDGGMMQNFEVLPPPTLEIQRAAGSVTLSWPDTFQDWILESSPLFVSESSWQTVRQVPQAPLQGGGKWTVTVDETGGQQFYRLRKSEISRGL
jgi:hypothetical protein